MQSALKGTTPLGPRSTSTPQVHIWILSSRSRRDQFSRFSETQWNSNRAGHSAHSSHSSTRSTCRHTHQWLRPACVQSSPHTLSSRDPSQFRAQDPASTLGPDAKPGAAISFGPRALQLASSSEVQSLIHSRSKEGWHKNQAVSHAAKAERRENRRDPNQTCHQKTSKPPSE